MKNDYTYIALLDTDATTAVRDMQKKLAASFGYSEYMDQWLPHSTISFGNLLSEKELEEVKNKCNALAAERKKILIDFDDIVIKKKEVQGKTFYSVRLHVKENKELEELSKAVQSIAKEYENPFDAFTEDHFHVSLGRYESPDMDQSKLKEILGAPENIPKSFLSGFSIFYSMLNDPKPDKAKEIATFNLQ